jgi:Kef-type K+ transport system membrane component KefB
MLGVVVVIPLAFRAFAAFVAPVAPKSEFAFLLMVAVVCAYATRRLGVYYLVGAFIVGIAAQRFRTRLPAMSSEKMIDALEAFGSVFIPFYFFRSGMHIDRTELTWPAIGLGALFLVLFVPLRAGITVLHRRLALSEALIPARRIGVALLPTLVFTLVLSDILRTRFGADGTLLGALVIYTVLNTMIPAFVLRSGPPSFEEVET